MNTGHHVQTAHVGTIQLSENRILCPGISYSMHNHKSLSDDEGEKPLEKQFLESLCNALGMKLKSVLNLSSSEFAILSAQPHSLAEQVLQHFAQAEQDRSGAKFPGKETAHCKRGVGMVVLCSKQSSELGEERLRLCFQTYVWKGCPSRWLHWSSTVHSPTTTLTSFLSQHVLPRW